MRPFRSAAQGAALAAILILATAPAGAQTPAAAPARFVVSADGQEVLDNSTQLLWRRCAEGMQWDGKTCKGKPVRFSLASAKMLAADIAKGSGRAWRVPEKDELLALVLPTKKGPTIDLLSFPATPAALFGALRPGFDDNLNGWTVNFRNGHVLGYTGQAKFNLRLVRRAS